MNDAFRVQLERANQAAVQAQKPASSVKPVAGSTFAETLAGIQDVHFSNHAQKRLQSRDINLSEDNVSRLSNAIDKAEKRGGQNSLVLVDDMAFIVNVRDRMVVTALDARNRGEGVFTQIDSVVFADPAKQDKTPSIDFKG